jgi:uncharacterized protein YbbC (DUF1343 family)
LKSIDTVLMRIFLIALIFVFFNSVSSQIIDLDKQIEVLFAQLKGKRVGVLTNPTGVNQKLDMLID